MATQCGEWGLAATYQAEILDVAQVQGVAMGNRGRSLGRAGLRAARLCWALHFRHEVDLLFPNI